MSEKVNNPDSEEKNIHSPTDSKSTNLDDWMIEDLEKSGLGPSEIEIIPLKNDYQLWKYLGRNKFSGKSILEVGGYFIKYPMIEFYRLKLKTPIDDAKYLSPQNKGNHAYITPEVAKIAFNYNPDHPLFLPEGEKKAAKATLEGFPCIGLSGVWNFKDSESDFLVDLEKIIWKDRKVYIPFDSDITEKHGVRHAELVLAITLMNRGAIVFSVRLPNEPNGEKNGLDDFLIRYGAEAFRVLVIVARPTLELHVDEGTSADLILKELPRLNNEILREKVIKSIANREKVKMDVVEAEFQKYLPKDKKGEQAPQETFTTEQLEKAESLLNSPDILSRMLNSTKHLGFTGEEINQKLLYLSFTSRLMDNSISTIVKGQSSSGKSHLVGTILRLFPESDTLNFSFVTSKALVHRQGDLSHKILFIQEHSGSEGAEYSVRTLLSEGEISIMLPVKDEATGKFETVEKRIPAKGLVFVETTTRDRIHHENQTRLFDLYVDESESQTANILSMQAAQLETKNQEATEEVKVWRAAQTLLKSYSVYIPYANELASAFPKDKTRARRDFPRLLSLIRAHVLLYQLQRDIDPDGRLIAEVKDFEAILTLAETVLDQSMKGVGPKQEAILKIIQKEFSSWEFSVKEIYEKAGGTPSYRTLQRYIEFFTKEGVLEWNGFNGSRSRYTLSQAHVSLCRSSRIFTPNLLETLKDNYDKPKCRDVSPCRNSVKDYDNNDKLRQTKNVANVSNDTGRLGEEEDIMTIATQGKEGNVSLKSLKDAGSTDPEDWDEEEQDFLSAHPEEV